MPFIPPSRRLGAGFALLALLATPSWARQVAEVQVVPESITLHVGERRPILATAFDAAGNVLLVRFRFASSDTSVVGVDATGALLARRPGLARVEARAGTKAGAVMVAVRGIDGPTDRRTDGVAAPAQPVDEPPVPTVEPPPPAHPRVESLLLQPGTRAGPVEIEVGTTRRFIVLPKDSADADIPGVEVAWETGDPTVARVDPSGEVHGVAAGATTVTARVAGFRPVTWEVRVTAPSAAPDGSP